MNVIEFKGPAPAGGPAVSNPQPRPPVWWRRRWFKIVVALAMLGCASFVIISEYLLTHREHLLGDLEPLVRQRVIETLSAHFNSPVELDRLNVSVVNGVAVEGDGLRIQHIARVHGPVVNAQEAEKPMLSVQKFSFRTELKNLLHSPTRIVNVRVEGMELHIPPSSRRGKLLGSKEHAEPADPNNPKTQPKISLLVDNIVCKDVKLFIESNKPGKDPLEFDIQDLHLRDVGASQPFTYQAKVINPKPVGEVQSTGHFGPWNSDDPAGTALDGTYSFSHADLNTIKGIGGILSSKGRFAGELDEITVDGETDTPDFSLDVSDHPVPLHTKFHAIVDGTNGDTYLQPVQARLLHSDFTARGKVVNIKGKGHDIALDVDIPHARMEDMLRLGVKTSPPLMNGVLSMKTKLHIPPGDVRVPLKLELAGNFSVQDVQFNNPQIQDKVDGMSMRAQGKPKEVKEASSDKEAQVQSDMQATFKLGHGLMTVSDLKYQIPGADVLMNGVYSLDGNIFEFKGHLRTEAKASQMVTGWKSWLLKPVDPFLKKHGAGLQLPISISGTQSDVHFGLAMHGSADESAEQIAQDLKENRQSMLEDAKAKREREKAQKAQDKAANSSGAQRTHEEHKAAKEQKKAEHHEAAAEAAKQP